MRNLDFAKKTEGKAVKGTDDMFVLASGRVQRDFPQRRSHELRVTPP